MAVRPPGVLELGLLDVAVTGESLSRMWRSVAHRLVAAVVELVDDLERPATVEDVPAYDRPAVLVAHVRLPSDLAAPGTCLLAPGLDEVLEPPEVAGRSAPDEAELVARLFDEALRLDVQLEHDACGRVVDPVEGDGAGIAGARP